MEDTVKITGDALAYLNIHSGLIREFLADSNEKDVFEIPVHLLPNKDIDAKFLQEYKFIYIEAAIYRKTGLQVIGFSNVSTPFNTCGNIS